MGSGSAWYGKIGKCEWVYCSTALNCIALKIFRSAMYTYVCMCVCMPLVVLCRFSCEPTSLDNTPDVSRALKRLHDRQLCQISCAETARASRLAIVFHSDHPTLVPSLLFVATCKQFELSYCTEPNRIVQCIVNKV